MRRLSHLISQANVTARGGTRGDFSKSGQQTSSQKFSQLFQPAKSRHPNGIEHPNGHLPVAIVGYVGYFSAVHTEGVSAVRCPGPRTLGHFFRRREGGQKYTTLATDFISACQHSSGGCGIRVGMCVGLWVCRVKVGYRTDGFSDKTPLLGHFVRGLGQHCPYSDDGHFLCF